MKNEVMSANVSNTFNFSGFDKPEDYVLFLPRPADREASARREAQREESGEVVTVRWSSPITVLALFFFTPIFGTELFFAASRSFICDISDACSAYNGPT